VDKAKALLSRLPHPKLALDLVAGRE
jgi:hypothetical protein